MSLIEYPDVTVVLGGAGYLGSAVVRALKSDLGQSRAVSVDRAMSDLDRDLLSPEVFGTLFPSLVGRATGRRVGLVVATGYSPFTPTIERTRAEAVLTLETNLLIPLWAMNSLVTYCRDTDSTAVVVLVGSVYGHFAPDFAIYEHLERFNSEVYGASKAGLVALARYYSKLFYFDGIRVNVLAPGGIYDASTHSQEFVEAYRRRTAGLGMVSEDQVVAGVKFLLSDMSSGVIGQTLHVDGGYGI